MKPSDFDWSFRGVRVRETGAFVPFTPALFKDIYIWWRYYRAETRSEPAAQEPFRNVACHPREIQNVYLLWGAMQQARLRALGPDAQTDLQFHFSDQTYINDDNTNISGLNGKCTDISKSKVAAVFENVFGYALRIDPLTAPTPFICKSELNGKHDGFISYENRNPQEGWVYQKLIQTETDKGTVLDLRCPTVFGDIPLIYLKERPINKRFANMNSQCRLAETSDYLSDEERTKISRFCQEMNLDWGGLDILRDNSDKKIYVVDVNKTDMGPPFALPLKDKLASTRILGLALRRAVDFHYPPAVNTAEQG